MYRYISPKVQDTVANIVLQGMKEAFRDGITFGHIEVEGEEFRDGEPCLRVTIVYEGDLPNLDSHRMFVLIEGIRDKLADEGIEEFPVTYFSEKSAWESRKQRRKKIAGG